MRMQVRGYVRVTDELANSVDLSIEPFKSQFNKSALLESARKSMKPIGPINTLGKGFIDDDFERGFFTIAFGRDAIYVPRFLLPPYNRSRNRKPAKMLHRRCK